MIKGRNTEYVPNTQALPPKNVVECPGPHPCCLDNLFHLAGVDDLAILSRESLRKLGMNCSRFRVNEPHSVSNYTVKVSQVHTLATVIKSEKISDWYSRTCWRNLFVRTLNMLKLMRNGVHQFEL